MAFRGERILAELEANNAEAKSQNKIEKEASPAEQAHDKLSHLNALGSAADGLHNRTESALKKFLTTIDKGDHEKLDKLHEMEAQVDALLSEFRAKNTELKRKIQVAESRVEDGEELTDDNAEDILLTDAQIKSEWEIKKQIDNIDDQEADEEDNNLKKPKFVSQKNKRDIVLTDAQIAKEVKLRKRLENSDDVAQSDEQTLKEIDAQNAVRESKSPIATYDNSDEMEETIRPPKPSDLMLYDSVHDTDQSTRGTFLRKLSKSSRKPLANSLVSALSAEKLRVIPKLEKNILPVTNDRPQTKAKTEPIPRTKWQIHDELSAKIRKNADEALARVNANFDAIQTKTSTKSPDIIAAPTKKELAKFKETSRNSSKAAEVQLDIQPVKNERAPTPKEIRRAEMAQEKKEQSILGKLRGKNVSKIDFKNYEIKNALNDVMLEYDTVYHERLNKAMREIGTLSPMDTVAIREGMAGAATFLEEKGVSYELMKAAIDHYNPALSDYFPADKSDYNGYLSQDPIRMQMKSKKEPGKIASFFQRLFGKK